MKARSRLTGATAVLVLAMVSSMAAARSNCRLEQIDEWPVRQVQNHLIVDGTVNGQRVDVMLGTGAQQTVMLRSAAERLHLHRKWTNGFPMLGIGGQSRLETATVDDIGFGRFAGKGWRLLVPIDQNLGEGFDIVLGDDFFHAVDVEFDLAHNVVRLFRPRDCDGASLAYWAPASATEVAMERVLDARPQIIMEVRINGRPVQALLDSGATVSVLTKHDARAAGVTTDSPGVVAVGKLAGFGENLVDSWTGAFKSFAVGDEMFRDIVIRFADVYENATYATTGSHNPRNLDQDQPMLLGVDFLRAHRVFVAHSQRKIYLTYVRFPVFETTGLAPASSTWLAPVDWRRQPPPRNSWRP